MNVRTKMVVLLIVTGLMAARLLCAQDVSSKAKEDATLSSGKGLAAVVTGENICLGCTLKKEKGAASQCSVYGHRHSLRVTGVTVGGKDMPDMKGWVLHYLETQKSEDLIKQHDGESLTIIGTIYPTERVLEVTSIKSEKPQTQGASPKPDQPKKPEHPEHPK